MSKTALVVGVSGIVGGDPLGDVRVLKAVSFVMKGGAVVPLDR